MNALFDQFVAWVAADPLVNIPALLSMLVACASIIVAGTPTPAPDSALGRIYKVLEFLALTIGRAKECGDGKAACEAKPKTLGKTVLALALAASLLALPSCAGRGTGQTGGDPAVAEQYLTTSLQALAQTAEIVVCVFCAELCAAMQLGSMALDAAIALYRQEPTEINFSKARQLVTELKAQADGCDGNSAVADLGVHSPPSPSLTAALALAN